MRKVPVKNALLPLVLVLALGALLMPPQWWGRLYRSTVGSFFRYSVDDRLKSFREDALARLDVRLLPEKLRILVLKEEKRLQLYGFSGGSWGFLAEYPVLAASGIAGPKLREGDRQVPEGIYGIESLHPNSHFYLALKVAYPAAEDIRCARLDGRDTRALGSNIMIHGRGGSIGCVAIDNGAMEEVFTLTALTGVKNTELLIAPRDFRTKAQPEVSGWLRERYETLAAEMKVLPPHLECISGPVNDAAGI